jgi:hypothetical protein
LRLCYNFHTTFSTFDAGLGAYSKKAMTFKLDGLEKLQRDLAAAGSAFEALDGHVLSFDAHDPSSMEGVLARADEAVDNVVGRYPGNNVVTQMGEQIRRQLREQILQKAASFKLQTGAQDMPEQNEVLDALQGIRDAVVDLQSADYQGFARPAKRLARTLALPCLQPAVSVLIEGLDLDSWLEKCKKSQGSMVGSAVLSWPESDAAELGTVILLINKFAADPDSAWQFSHTFYYASGNSTSGDLRKMVGAMLVPFERDFGKYARSKLVNEERMSSSKVSGAATNINIHNSTIGAVQTGSHSSAAVSMEVNHAHFDALASSLEALSKAMARVVTLPNHDKGEILELIGDSRSELVKEKPNLAKLRSLLPTIGSAVGLVSELGSAYEVVKSAAGAVGISL